MSKLRKNERGVSIVELLVVVFLLGMLTPVMAYFGVSQLKKGKDAKRKADLEKIRRGLYEYLSDANCFPDTLPDCGQPLKLNTVNYIERFPCDPNGESYGYQVDSSGCSQWFKILTNLENLDDGGIVKTGCQSGCGQSCNYNYGLSSSNISVNDGCVFP